MGGDIPPRLVPVGRPLCTNLHICSIYLSAIIAPLTWLCSSSIYSFPSFGAPTGVSFPLVDFVPIWSVPAAFCAASLATRQHARLHDTAVGWTSAGAGAKVPKPYSVLEHDTPPAENLSTSRAVSVPVSPHRSSSTLCGYVPYAAVWSPLCLCLYTIMPLSIWSVVLRSRKVFLCLRPVLRLSP